MRKNAYLKQLRDLLVALTIGCLGTSGVSYAEPPQYGETIDRDKLESFVNGVVGAYMKNQGIVGSVVSVVHNGEIVFSKGFGYADIGKGLKANNTSTVFRVGSISKPFVWTSIMQLKEQGKLRLDDDIRDLITSFDVELDFDEPVTVLDLMNHAAGFEDTVLGHLWESDPENLEPFIEYTGKVQPKQVRKPGQMFVYCNHCNALAAVAISDITGMDYESYVEENIFAPLGMTHSSVREPWGDNLPTAPLPQRLIDQSVKGYSVKNGVPEEGRYYFVHKVGPTGAMVTTADDMAHFMLAHLQDGELNGTRILQTQTAQEMHKRSYSMAEDMTGVAHGFWEADVGGYRSYGHSGGLIEHQSDMKIVPELGLGVFISTNTITGWELAGDLTELIVKEFFPKPTPAETPAPAANAAEDLEKYAGSYILGRRSHTTLERFMTLLLMSTNVSVTDDGYLIVKGATVPAAKYVQIAPDKFQALGDGSKLKFTQDTEGKDVMLFSHSPFSAHERIGFFQSMSWLYGVLILSLLVFIVVLAKALIRRIYKQSLPSTPKEKLARTMLLSGAGLWIITIVALLGGFASAAFDFGTLITDFPPAGVKIGITLAIAGALVTIAAVGLLVPVWRGGRWGLWRRVGHTLVVGFMVATTFVLHNLNAIGYNYF